MLIYKLFSYHRRSFFHKGGNIVDPSSASYQCGSQDHYNVYNVAAGLFYRTTKQPGGDSLLRITLHKDCSIIKVW